MWLFVDILGAIHFGYAATARNMDIAIDLWNMQSLIEASSRRGLSVAWESKLGRGTLNHDDMYM
jgi:hypothetical protein